MEANIQILLQSSSSSNATPSLDMSGSNEATNIYNQQLQRQGSSNMYGYDIH